MFKQKANAIYKVPHIYIFTECRLMSSHFMCIDTLTPEGLYSVHKCQENFTIQLWILELLKHANIEFLIRFYGT